VADIFQSAWDLFRTAFFINSHYLIRIASIFPRKSAANGFVEALKGTNVNQKANDS
jgi:hypothetical protein